MAFDVNMDRLVGPKRAAALRRLLLCALVAPLSACGTDRMATGSIVPEDYRERHPIVIGENANTLSIFSSGLRLDHNDHARLVELAHDARVAGDGRIEILFPRGSANEDPARASLGAIRAALAEGGARGGVSVGEYAALSPRAMAPIRVSYRAVSARVGNRCGEWPADLASASSLEGWENRPYWNFGCSYQSAFAAQVDDPRDLVEPRASTPSDVDMRTRAIGKVRQGADPATTWTVQNSSISSVGGK